MHAHTPVRSKLIHQARAGLHHVQKWKQFHRAPRTEQAAATQPGSSSTPSRRTDLHRSTPNDLHRTTSRLQALRLHQAQLRATSTSSIYTRSNVNTYPSTRQAGVERDAILGRLLRHGATARHRRMVAKRDAFKRRTVINKPAVAIADASSPKVFIINAVFNKNHRLPAATALSTWMDISRIL